MTPPEVAHLREVWNRLPEQDRQEVAFWRQRSKLASRLDQLTLALAVITLYPWQKRYIFDDARSRAVVASRQVGKSAGAIGWGAVLQGLATPKRDQIIVSASRDLSNENIEKCSAVVAALESILRMTLHDDEGKQNTGRVTLHTGSRVIGRPASKRTTRGYTGDVHWDEAGVTPFDSLIWKGIAAVATRGNYRLSLLGTPFGDTGVFHDVCEGKRARVFSQHRITIHQAVKEQVARGDKPIDVKYLESINDSDTFEQEYLCKFLSDAASYFSWGVLQQLQETGVRLMERAGLLTPGWDIEGFGAALAGDDDEPSAFDEDDAPSSVDQAGDVPCSWYGGMDVGRRRDLSAQAWGRKFNDEKLLIHRPDAVKNMPFPEQKKWFEGGVLAHRPIRVYIDEGGLGMERAEDLERLFPGIVSRFNFGGRDNKRRLVENLKKRVENGEIGIEPGDRVTLRELHSIRRNYTQAGNVSYTADRTEDGHADRATAVMLCALAAFDGGGGSMEVADVANIMRDAIAERTGLTPYGVEGGNVRSDPNSARAALERRQMEGLWEGSGAEFGEGGDELDPRFQV